MGPPTLRQLRTLLAIADAGSFARAAAALHLTQPAVSMQIRELEDALGLPLLDRGARGLRLTAAGEDYLPHARRVFATLADGADAIARLRGLKGGRVQVGMVGTAQYFLPRLIARFRARHREIGLRLRLGNREQLVQALLAREVDFAVMGRPPPELATRAEAFAPHPLGVIAAPEHPLARRRALAPTALGAEEFIVRERGSGTRAAMEAYFREHALDPPIVMEMPGNETIKQAVMANMGLAFLSLHTVAQERARGQLRVLDVRGLPLKRRWHLVRQDAQTLSPAAAAFHDFVIEEGERLLESLVGARRRSGAR